MTLRFRLALGLVAIALVLLIPLAISLVALDRLNDETRELQRGDFQASLILGQLRESVQEARSAETAWLFVGDSATRERLTRSVGTMQSLADSLRAFELDSAAARLRAAVREVAVATPDLITAVQAKDTTRADAISSDRTGPALVRAESGIFITERSLRQRTYDRVRAVSLATGRAQTVAAISLGAALVVALGLALWLLRSIAHPVRSLERGMQAIADGELDHPLGIDPHRQDEFGRLAAGYQEMVRRLAELNKLKAEFISIASHELRTPVNVMVGYVQLLQEGVYGPVSAKQKEILQTVETQGHTLGRLTRHLLDISRFEAGGSHIEPRAMALPAFLEELERAFHVLAIQRDVRFLVTLGEGLPAEVVWDSDRMNEVVGNLLGNAFKFTPRGGSVELRAEPHDDESVLITVHDTGAGIPRDQLTQIFQKFYQAPNQKAAAQEGTGLGLAISKEIVEAHRGSIRADSGAGAGTTFSIVLPRVVRRRSYSHVPAPVEVG